MTESLDEEQLALLVYGYSAKISEDDWIVPDTIITMINHYIPKLFWLHAGEAIVINDKRDTISTYNNGWSTAYSTSKAILSQEHKYIWQISILKCGSFDDIRIGIASTESDLNDEFAYSTEGHNYSYITYGKASCVGYNGEFQSIDHVDYGPGDIITIELDLNEKCVSYFKNKTFVHKQSNIYCTDYRLAAAMFGTVQIKIISFQRIFVNE